MGKTYRQEKNRKLFSNGDRGHRHSLAREFKGVNCMQIRDGRGLILERDYDSDRMKRTRMAASKARRQHLKKVANQIIEDELNEE